MNINLHMNATREPLIGTRPQPRSPKKGAARRHHRGLLCLVLAVSLHANAALTPVTGLGPSHDHTVVKDTDSGLMWLQNANLGGTMTWSQAKTWADTLVYAGYDDWRLPSAGLVSSDPMHPVYAHDGSGDYGYNIVRDEAELAHLYNGVLDNPSYCNADCSLTGTANGWSWPHNNGPFTNVNLANSYWLDEAFAPNPPNPSYAWTFYAYYGRQSAPNTSTSLGAWAVRSDVAAVPLPGALALFGSALAGLLGFVRRRHPLVIR